jgi:geranylgeranyl diphosphate synthase, type II
LAADFVATLTDRRPLIEAELRTWLTRVTEDAPAPIVEAMSYSLFSPGKRLRPLLCAAACEAAGGKFEDGLAAGCAVEMVHCYSLIHDDLPAMDDDDLRRGQPTSHKKFGEALAILAGDALLTGAFQVLAEGYPPRTAAVSCAELARGAGTAGMVGGQVLDLGAEGKIPGGAAPRTTEDLENVHSRKTGALFRTSLRLGLLAAQGERLNGPDPEVTAALDRYGRAFGLAFQIADDLLDVQGTSDRAGKRVGKDEARGKLTFPGLLGVEESRRRASALYADAAAALASIAHLGPATGLLAGLVRQVMERDR